MTRAFEGTVRFGCKFRLDRVAFGVDTYPSCSLRLLANMLRLPSFLNIVSHGTAVPFIITQRLVMIVSTKSSLFIIVHNAPSVPDPWPFQVYPARDLISTG